jgi:hypothetical protein
VNLKHPMSKAGYEYSRPGTEPRFQDIWMRPSNKINNKVLFCSAISRIADQ